MLGEIYKKLVLLKKLIFKTGGDSVIEIDCPTKKEIPVLGDKMDTLGESSCPEISTHASLQR
jgi:hypothetical protein